MSSIAGSASSRPFQRFADGFGRFSVVLSVVGLVVAAALSVPSSWLDFGGDGDETAATTYSEMTPAAPVRVAMAGAVGVELVAPLVESGAEPRRALREPPTDAPLVGWWTGSARAGADKGQTLLLAHAGATGGGLTQIADLAKGDTVDLLTRQGTMRYEVATVRTFDPETMARVGLTLFKQDGGAGRLVMVSAEGWDGVAYQRSVVVTASPLGKV